MLKNLKKKWKRRTIKTKRPSVEHKTVTEIKLSSTGNCFCFFTETAPKVEKNKIK